MLTPSTDYLGSLFISHLFLLSIAPPPRDSHFRKILLISPHICRNKWLLDIGFVSFIITVN